MRKFLPLFLVLWSACSSPPEPKRIAITFDDAPIVKPLSYESQWARAQAVDSLVAALQTRGVPATVFAIASDLSDPDLVALAGMWTAAGVDVANHSVSHRSFNELDREEGVREIAQAQAVLSRTIASDRTRRYFRFPFLEEGRTLADKAAWMSVLDSLAMAPARVSITTDDWRFDNDYAEAEATEDWERRYEVGQEYLAHVKSSVRHWDGLASELYGRNVAHVLMLHANRVNRDYLGELLDWLESEGFEFISLDEAYRDRIYQEETSWLGASGVSILEHIKQTRLARGEYSGS